MDNNLGGFFMGYSIGKMIAIEREKRLVSEIRNLSKCGFEREAIRDLIEEKYNIILKNEVLDSYL